MSGFLAIVGLIVAAQTAVAFAGWPWRWRLALALLAFPVVGGLITVALGLFTGYWHG